jgi:hypothetical protein
VLRAECPSIAVAHGAKTLPSWGTTLGLLTLWATTVGFLPLCPTAVGILSHLAGEPTVGAVDGENPST